MSASPLPYSKTCDTFRAADCTAIGTGLGRETFVDDFERDSVPQGFVAEHLAERRPAGIKHGFCHPRLRQVGRIHVADDNVAVLAHDPRRLFMQEMSPAVFRFRMQRRRAALLSALLRQCEPLFVTPVKRRHFDLAPVAQHGEVFESEIDGNSRPGLRGGFSNLDLNVEIPTPTGVLAKTRGLDFGIIGDAARIPESVFAAEDDDNSAPIVNAERAGGIEWNPAETALLARAPRGIARLCKLPSNRRKSIAVDAKINARARHQPAKIKPTWPARDRPRTPAALSFALGRTAKVPGIIDRTRHAPQILGAGFVLDAIAVGKDHALKPIWSEGNMQDIRTGRHVVYNLHAHLVFVTKYRRNVLSALAVRDLKTIFAKVCDDFESELIECDGADDHVHLLIVYPPKIILSRLVNSLKGVSSRRLREDRPEISGRYRKGVLWSPSYFVASCGGAPLSIIAEYVRNQREAALPPRPEGRGFRAGKR